MWHVPLSQPWSQAHPLCLPLPAPYQHPTSTLRWGQKFLLLFHSGLALSLCAGKAKFDAFNVCTGETTTIEVTIEWSPLQSMRCATPCPRFCSMSHLVRVGAPHAHHRMPSNALLPLVGLGAHSSAMCGASGSGQHSDRTIRSHLQGNQHTHRRVDSMPAWAVSDVHGVVGAGAALGPSRWRHKALRVQPWQG